MFIRWGEITPSPHPYKGGNKAEAAEENGRGTLVETTEEHGRSTLAEAVEDILAEVAEVHSLCPKWPK